MKIKLNRDMDGKKKGDVIVVPSRDGVMTELFWRRRLKDSETDNCITIMDVKKTKYSSKSSKKDEANKSQEISR